MESAVGLTECGDAVVVTATGEFDIATVDLLRDAFDRAIASEPTVIVVDLTAGTLYDSVAIGAVLDAREAMRARAGVLLIRSESRVLGRVLDHLGAHGVLAA